MRILSTHGARAYWLALVSLALAGSLLHPGTARAQAPYTPPGEDHYLVYAVLNPPTLSVPVTLGDQFTPVWNTVAFTLEYFMTPVNKNNEGIIDPVTHYTWWKVETLPFGATCVIDNQFGPGQGVNVFQPRWLLNPALKNQPAGGQIPLKNHYVAYDATGRPPGAPVSLVDQFGPWTGIVDTLRYLAPPSVKTYAGAQFPIVDPVNHLAIYHLANLQPPLTAAITVTAQDEFGFWPLVLGPQVYLCVPSYKSGVVGTKRSTWGRIKTLYR